VEKGRRVRSDLVLVNESAQKSTAARKRERTGVVLLRQGSKRPGDRLVTRVFGHPDDFESILAPHARGCCDTRDLASSVSGRRFREIREKTLVFFFITAANLSRSKKLGYTESAWRLDNQTTIPNPRAGH